MRARASLRNRHIGPSIIGFEDEGNNLYRGLANGQVQADMRTHLIHRSREGHHSTAWWSSSFLLGHSICNDFHVTAASLVQRKSVPSTQMRCRITANRRASATIARFMPRCFAIFIAQALSQDHRVERTSMYGTIHDGPGAMVIVDVDRIVAPAIAAVVASSDGVHNVKAHRIYTMEEVATIRKKRIELQGSYSPPGQ